jgi:hypothetical protein
MGYTDAQIQDELNRSMPAASRARLGDVVYGLMNGFNGLLAALDTADIAGLGAGRLKFVLKDMAIKRRRLFGVAFLS